MNMDQFTSINECLEAAASALERAQEFAAAAKEKALMRAVAGVVSALGDVIDDLNQTSIHE